MSARKNQPAAPYWTLVSALLVLFACYAIWGLFDPATQSPTAEVVRLGVFIGLALIAAGGIRWICKRGDSGDHTASGEASPAATCSIATEATLSEANRKNAALDDARREIARLESAVKSESAKAARAEQALRTLEARSGAASLTIKGVFESFLRSLDGQVRARLEDEDIVLIEFSSRAAGLTDVAPLLKRWTAELPSSTADQGDESISVTTDSLELVGGNDTPRPRVLVAEDDPVSRQILKSIFSRQPAWEVKFVANGVQAWQALAEGYDPQVCVFDHLMPGLDGLTVVERMRKDLRFMHTGVIMCTASRNRADISKAGALRIAHYLVKPYKAVDVLDTVRTTLEQTQGTQSAAEKQLGLSSAEFAAMVEAVHHDTAKATEEAREHFIAGRTQRAVHALQRVQSAAINLQLDDLATSLGRLARAYEDKSFGDAAIEWDQLQQALGELGVAAVD